MLAIAAPPAAFGKGVDLDFLKKLQDNQVDFAHPAAATAPVRAVSKLPQFVSYPALQQDADSILKTLEANHPGSPPEHATFVITDQPFFECTTLPNGVIACSVFTLQKLLHGDLSGRQQMAFLLAHELGHRLIAGHAARFDKAARTKAQVAQIGFLTALALDVALSQRTVSGSTVTITATAQSTNAFWMSLMGGANMGAALSGAESLAWSQQEEDEADTYALYLMHRAGLDMSAASQLFGSMQEDVRNKRVSHDSEAKLAAEQAASATALQALLGSRSPISLGLSAVMGGASAMEQVSKYHYHRDFGDRVQRCSTIAKAIEPADETQLTTYNPNPPAILAQAAPPPAAPTSRARRAPGGRRRPEARTVAVVAPPRPKSIWERSSDGSDPTLEQVMLAHQVRDALAMKGPKAAEALCLSRPDASALALACGLAHAGDGDVKAAEPLIDKALADPFATDAMFKDAALAEAKLQGPPRALKVLDQGEARFPGQFYAERVSLLIASGDLAAAKTEAETCKQKADATTRMVCERIILRAQSAKANGLTAS